MPLRCDIFCTAIDNYGDIGVCWRLARQLAGEHSCLVTLWLDDLAAMAHMRAGIDPSLDEQPLPVAGSEAVITLRRWQPEYDTSPGHGTPRSDARSGRHQAEPGDLVIEGFACRLPDAFLSAMAARPHPPVWLNLEYLSAEQWVDGCHGLPSTHPRTGLTQHFWFPGFTTASGGLLREAGLPEARDAFQRDQSAQLAFWQRLDLPDALCADRRISLFAYENPAIPGLLQMLADAAQGTLLLVPAGRALTDVSAWAGGPNLRSGDRLRRGNLDIAVLPFLDHADYDRLLWACDLNAVRGEDSFVRAQWAARPMLWHIYPQDDQAHEAKLRAWLDLLRLHSPAMPAIWADTNLAWNQVTSATCDWSALMQALPGIAAATRHWSQLQAARADLASGIAAVARVGETPAQPRRR